MNGTSASASGLEQGSTNKDQIEMEMKQMIEKMRDYKAKDPSLFTQIWEQVKKVSDDHLVFNSYIFMIDRALGRFIYMIVQLHSTDMIVRVSLLSLLLRNRIMARLRRLL